METDTNSQSPSQQNEKTGEPPISAEQSPEPQSDKPKNSKRKLLWILLVLLLFVASTAAYYYYKKNNKPADSSASKPVKTEVKKDETLTYATKLSKTGKVQVKNITKNTTAEEVSFAESYEYSPDSGNVWEFAKPSVDLNSDGTELAYINDNNLIVRDVKDNKEETIIKKVSSETYGGEGGITKITLDPAPPKVGGPGLSLISSPNWSREGKDIGFSMGFYEGGAVQVINRTTKEYAVLGDTFRYIEEEGIPTSKFTLLAENKPLAGFGLYGGYLVKEAGFLQVPTVTLDSKKDLAILCPKDQPGTGDSQYLESAMSAEELAEYKKRRDCGETGDRSLISIDLSDGSYKEVGTGKFGLSIALQSPDIVYVGGSKDSGHNVTKIYLSGSATSSSLDVKKLGELTADDTIEGTIVKNAGYTPVLEIYIKNNDKQSVKVVNLKTEKLVTSVDLEAKMGYTTLGLSQ